MIEQNPNCNEFLEYVFFDKFKNLNNKIMKKLSFLYMLNRRGKRENGHGERVISKDPSLEPSCSHRCLIHDQLCTPERA